MEFLQFWAAALSSMLYAACFLAIGLVSRKSALLKPAGAGLNLIALFVMLQVFLRLGVEARFPRVATHLNFYSWLVFSLTAVRRPLPLRGPVRGQVKTRQLSRRFQEHHHCARPDH